ncbi:hypothetical protein JTB14_006736 [Gonioctena quinquepunctata]|nr:hypothetical protein JTB14_006736 [Gonioctena quinquepunctata]
MIDLVKESHDTRICNKLFNAPPGSKIFWSLAKAIHKNFTSSSPPPLERSNGMTVVFSKEEADLLAHILSFNSIFDTVGKQFPTIPRINSTMLEVAFTSALSSETYEIMTLTGSDGIPIIILKKCTQELTQFSEDSLSYHTAKWYFCPCRKTLESNPSRKKNVDHSCELKKKSVW